MQIFFSGAKTFRIELKSNRIVAVIKKQKNRATTFTATDEETFHFDSVDWIIFNKFCHSTIQRSNWNSLCRSVYVIACVLCMRTHSLDWRKFIDTFFLMWLKKTEATALRLKRKCKANELRSVASFLLPNKTKYSKMRTISEMALCADKYRKASEWKYVWREIWLYDHAEIRNDHWSCIVYGRLPFYWQLMTRVVTMLWYGWLAFFQILYVQIRNSHHLPMRSHTQQQSNSVHFKRTFFSLSHLLRLIQTKKDAAFVWFRLTQRRRKKKIKCYRLLCVGVFLSDAINTTYIT